MGASGISTGFPVLSQSSGQVAHVLLTRSPLGLLRCCHRMDLVRLACIKHAASVRPEPGSNSPSRLLRRPEGRRKESESRPGRTHRRRPTTDRGRDPKGRSVRPAIALLLDARPRAVARSRPHWLLALALPFSRSDQALAPEGVDAESERVAVLTEIRFFSPMAPTGPSRRDVHCTSDAEVRQPDRPVQPTGPTDRPVQPTGPVRDRTSRRGTVAWPRCEGTRASGRSRPASPSCVALTSIPCPGMSSPARPGSSRRAAPAHFQRKWTKIRPKFLESFSIRWYRARTSFRSR
jgi:hypothetical protein